MEMNKMTMTEETKETIEKVGKQIKKSFEDYYDIEKGHWVWFCCVEKGCATIDVKNPLDSVIFVDAWRYLESECIKNQKVNDDE